MGIRFKCFHLTYKLKTLRNQIFFLFLEVDEPGTIMKLRQMKHHLLFKILVYHLPFRHGTKERFNVTIISAKIIKILCQ